MDAMFSLIHVAAFLVGVRGKCALLSPEPSQWATLGVGSVAGSKRGGRNVSATATAPTPIAEEPMNIHA
jgi:hypothetical protein